MPDDRIPSPPDVAGLAHLGSYRRVLPVSVERMYENALDWAHLPYVHAGTFRSIRLRDAGTWGWRADVCGHDGAERVLELRLDRDARSWVTRTLEGPGKGTGIHTRLRHCEGGGIEVHVDFLAPDIAPGHRQKVGAAYARLYAQLYDEDVAMMVERQRQLDRRIHRGSTPAVRLGSRGSLVLPQTFELAGRDYRLVEDDRGRLVAFPRQCPHQLGPLDEHALRDGVLTCPWHGYRFDVDTGANLSGQTCRLDHLPVVTVAADGEVSASLG